MKTKPDISFVSNLPDTMESDDLKKLIFSVINHDSGNFINKEVIAESLWELSLRQWHTYKIPDTETRDKIENWIHENWNTNYTEKYIQLVGGICGMLGLSKTYDELKTLLTNKSLSKQIKAEIETLVAEYGDSVDDPYKTDHSL